MAADIDSYLRRRDPQGYYVIPARAEALRYLERVAQDILVEEVDPYTILVRTRSRRKARELLQLLASKGLLADLG